MQRAMMGNPGRRLSLTMTMVYSSTFSGLSCTTQIYLPFTYVLRVMTIVIYAELLVVSNFTLFGNTRKGNKPEFSHGKLSK